MAANGQILKVRGKTPTEAYGQIVKVRGRAVVPAGGAAQTLRVRGRSVNSISLIPRTQITADPFQVVTLTATASQTPDSWVWTQLAGPTVTLVGSGAGRTYKAPATLDGAELAFQVSAVKSGQPTAVGVVTDMVRGHGGGFKYTSSAPGAPLVGVQIH